ncbi:MAG TPA: RodZ domain-containing protein [Methylomirabilota bacterium]|nr:RodZ domain-containing protein [Methylomirabilota bacterium]
MVSGRAAASAEVQVAAVAVEVAPPSFTVSDAAGTPVEIDPVGDDAEPVVLAVDGAGAFSGSLVLPPGTWDVTVVASGVGPVTRRVTVLPGQGLTGTLRLVDGESWLEVDEDGSPLEGASGNIRSAGDSIALQADDALRVRVGNAAAVELTINGIGLGTMGADGAVIEWRITRSDG